MINYMSIDDKGRLIIPSNMILHNSDKIAIRLEDDLAFTLTDLIKYNELLKKLKINRDKALNDGNTKHFVYLNEYINYLEFSKVSESNIDSQHRITIPKKVREMYELENRAFLRSGEDHIKVFKNEEKANEYCKRLVLKNDQYLNS